MRSRLFSRGGLALGAFPSSGGGSIGGGRHTFSIGGGDALFDELLGYTELMSAEEYLEVLKHPEKIDHDETEFVPADPGDPELGRFLVKWRYPGYMRMKVEPKVK